MNEVMRLASPGIALLSLLLLPGGAVAEREPPLSIPRASAPIRVDGALDEAAWDEAAVFDRFFEYAPGNNTEPKVTTVARVLYDGKALYVGVRCDDPEPSRIRAPFVERDQVFGDQDNVAVFLDTRGDGRSALQLRTNPRGVQADAMNDDGSGSEDFSPDFFYDTAARITSRGWEAEFRIPFSSLRYPKAPIQTWGFFVIRNYPREYRYQISSSPLPRGSNCFVCHERLVTGLSELPPGGHLVAAPYGTLTQEAVPREGEGEGLVTPPVEPEAGIDLKWTPSASTAVDGTLNPDFSQVESDVTQLDVNTAFALFYPEKRPFFLEGVDLLKTPITAIHTRTVTDPRWGARVTGKAGPAAYTVLVTQDRGGGSVVIPGSESSSFAPQDFSSLVAIGRLRYDLGSSFAGFVLTDREVGGGGHNRVLGPDFVFRPSEQHAVTGQLLFSDTRTPNRPDLAEEWDGRRLTSQAWNLLYQFQTETWNASVLYEDVGADFRADTGFVPQVGYRFAKVFAGRTFYPTGLLRFVQPYVVAASQNGTEGQLLSQVAYPGLALAGAAGLNLDLQARLNEKVRVEGQVLETSSLRAVLVLLPSRLVPRVELNARVGGQVDYANVRTGTGGAVTGALTLRPADRLELVGNGSLEWLDVDEDGTSGRLFTAFASRLKATYFFSSRLNLRLIGEYVSVDRNPDLYTFPVPEKQASFQGSALLSYRLNWQSVVFLGYGDERERSEEGSLTPAGRQLFVKVSYAFQM